MSSFLTLGVKKPAVLPHSRVSPCRLQSWNQGRKVTVAVKAAQRPKKGQKRSPKPQKGAQPKSPTPAKPVLEASEAAPAVEAVPPPPAPKKTPPAPLKPLVVALAELEDNSPVEPVVKAKAAKPANTFETVMAFSGPAPEIINGRIAMWAFFYGGLVELFSGSSILEQLSSSPFGVTSTVLSITLASFVPTIVSDYPFGELLETATEDGLPKQISLFTFERERLHGRIAMVGFLVVFGIELVSGLSVVNLAKSFL